MKILIIGAGNGGLAFGAKLTKQGAKVVLYDKFQEIVEPIVKNNNNITIIENGEKRKIKFHLVTNNLKIALKNTKIILVITPAFAHRSLAKELVNYISEEHIVILHPGRTGGALEVKKILNNFNVNPVTAEAETLLFACRKINSTTIQIYGTKNSVGIGTLPNKSSSEVVDLLNQYLPYFEARKNIFDTSLRNIGAIFHPAPFLLNLVKVEYNQSFKFYHEGITPRVASFLEELDQERLDIAEVYGINIPSALEWLNHNYSLNGSTLYESIQMNKSYKDIYAPLDIYSRYILEDIPMSLVPMSHIAKKVNIKTPILDSVIYSASAMYNENFFKNGRTIDKMGLN